MSLVEEKRKYYSVKIKEQHCKPKCDRISNVKMDDLRARIRTLNRWSKELRG